MAAPSVEFTRLDGQTGVVRPSAQGVLAIIAPAEKGTQNVAQSFARSSDVFATFGDGPLYELAAFFLAQARKPVLCVRPATSTAATYSAITSTGGGTSVATAGATAPFDSYDVIVEFIEGGTIGVAGITYRYSLDGGANYSAKLALGVATSILIPRSNVTVALAAGTITAGRKLTFTTTQAKPTGTDLVDAYEALRITGNPWDAVLVEVEADGTLIAGLDSWLAGLEASGKYRLGFMNAKRKGSSSEATYKTDLTTIRNAGTTIRVCVGADGAPILGSPARGLSLFRPASWQVATRTMSIDLEVEPAYVALGPLPSASVVDSSNNPTKGRLENLFPGLDDLKYTCFVSVPDRAGVFIGNTYLFSPDNSDYVYVPHGRVMNRAMEIAFSVLTTELSRGVDKNKEAEPNGAVYILESEAEKVEALVQTAVEKELGSRVSDVRFLLSRTDDLGSNGPGTLTGELQIQAKTYAKKFAIRTAFVRTVSASL